MANKKPKSFTHRFVDDGSNILLELTNATTIPLSRVEVLTVFLRNAESVSPGPAQVHIRFERVERILPAEKSLLAHTTLINGKVADHDREHLQRLQAVEGQENPYALDISWLDDKGKTRFQRIPVGH
jgi:hypothetical protein